MNEMSGRDLESQLRDHYRLMPVGSSRDVTARVVEAFDRAPSRRRPAFTLRRAAGVAAIAAAALIAGGLVSLEGTPSGAPSGSVAGASPAQSVASGASSGSSGALCASPTPGASSGASAAPCASPTGITKADAIAAVEKFIGRKLVGADVGDPTASATGQSIQIMEAGPNGVDAWVDAATGRVTSLLMMPVPETTNIALSSSQAQAAAAAFLTAHSVPFDGLTPAVTVEDHGCCKFYVVTLQRYVNGIAVPDTRIVKLDPSNGTVFSFTDTREQFGPVASPQIDRGEAIRLATVASGFSNPLVGEVQLIVDGGPTFRGRPVWSIRLDDGAGASASHAWIYVDAVTGEAKVVGRG